MREKEVEIDVEQLSRAVLLPNGPNLSHRRIIFTACEIRLFGLLRLVSFLVEISNINDKSYSPLSVRTPIPIASTHFPSATLGHHLARETRPHDPNRSSSNLFSEHFRSGLLRNCFSDDAAVYFGKKRKERKTKNNVESNRERERERESSINVPSTIRKPIKKKECNGFCTNLTKRNNFWRKKQSSRLPIYVLEAARFLLTGTKIPWVKIRR